MKNDSLFHEFKKFEGQPVRIFTDDGRKICGIDLFAFDDAVRILDKCGRVVLVDFSHIDAVLEPQMRIKCCDGRDDFCDDDCCDNHYRDRDRDRDCDDDHDEDRENFRRRFRKDEY